MPQEETQTTEQAPEETTQEPTVIQPSTSGFDTFQEDQCLEKDFITASPYCPDCIIDESAVPDDWKDPSYDEEAFLDKSKCEYVAVIDVTLENIVSKDQESKIEDSFDERRKELFTEMVTEYLQENPEAIGGDAGLLDWYSTSPKKRPPEAQRIWEEATSIITEEIQNTLAEDGYYIDTKLGKKNQKFSKLIDWARDPDRIRLGIRTILDEYEKQNNDKTVCAFGGCQYSMEDVKKSRSMIDGYIKGLHAAQKSINSQMQTFANDAPALTKVVGSGAMLAAYVIGSTTSWIGDIFGNSGNDEASRAVGKKFGDMMTGFFPSDVKNSLERLQNTYGVINPYALEWTAYVPDDGVYLLPDSNIVRYIVRVPAFNVDLLPKSNEKDDDDDQYDSSETISIENTDWRVNYTRMRTGLWLMQYEYDLFRLKDGGSIVFDKEGATSFDQLEFAPIRRSLDRFKRELEKLLNKNMMAFTYQKGNPFTWFNYIYHKTVDNVRLELAIEEINGNNTLRIKDVFVTISSCPEVKLTTKTIVQASSEDDETQGSIKSQEDQEAEETAGLASRSDSRAIYKKVKYLNTFKRRVCDGRADQTMLYLLGRMDTALMSFEAMEKTPLSDWAKEFIFPDIKINEGMSLGEEMGDKTTLQCMFENFPLMSAESWGQIFDDLVVGVWDTFRDELRKRMCADESKQIDPGLQMWFASQEAQEQVNKAYLEEVQRLIDRRKADIEQVFKISEKSRTGRVGPPLAEYENTFGDGLKIVAPSESIATDPEKLEKWKKSQLEAAMPFIRQKAGELAEKMKADARKEHPYSKHLKESILEGLPDYNNSLTKKFVDFVGGKNNQAPDEPQERFMKFLSDIGLCGLLLGLRKALGCLFGGIPLDEVMRTIFKKTIGALNIDQFLYFCTELLPVEKQVEVQEKVQARLDAIFEGVAQPVDAGNFLDRSLYKKRPETPNQTISDFSALGVGYKAGGAIGGGIQSLSSKISDFLDNPENWKYRKLSSPYVTDIKGYPKKGVTPSEGQIGPTIEGFVFKSPEQAAKDKKKLKKMEEKREKRKAKKDRREQMGYPTQGSVGQAAAQVVGILFEAYIEAIVESFNTSGLMQLYKHLPVLNMIPDVITDMFMCPGKPLINPPLKEMIEFNFKVADFCDPTKPVVDFNFEKLINPFRNPWSFLRDAIVAAVSKVLTELLIKIAIQFVLELEKLLCKLLEGAGRGALAYVTGDFEESPWTEAFRDAFCGADASDEEVQKTLAGALSTSGIATQEKAREVSQKVGAAFSGNFTKQEMMLVIFKTGDNPELLQRVSNAIMSYAPELGAFFDPPDKAAEIFTALSNLLPRSERERIRESLDDSLLDDTPVFNTICLTDEELDQWNNLRRGNLERRGLSPEDAAEQNENYNNRARETIASIMEQPENIQNAISQMLQPVGGRDAFGDPDPRQSPPGCDDGKTKINGLVDEPAELVSLSNETMDKLWRVINSRFIKDLYGGNDGIISRILSDTEGVSFARHGFLRRFFLTRNMWWDSVEQEKALGGGFNFFSLLPIPNMGYFPKTISLHLHKELQKDFEFTSKSLVEIKNGKSYDVSMNFFRASGIDFTIKTKGREKAEAKMTYEIPAQYYKTTLSGQKYVDDTGKGKYSKFRQDVSYSSQVLVPEIERNFNYRIKVMDKLNPFLLTGDMRTGTTNHYNIKVNQPMSADVENFLSEYESPSDKRFREGALEYTIGKIFNSYMPDNNITINTATYDSLITKVLSLFRDICIDKVPRDGQEGSIQVPVIEKGKATDETESVTVGEGFLFGYKESYLDDDEVTYVGPDGQEPYDFDEEEQVLGKMKKENPRVHILDPKRYGGSYNSPPWYVEDARYRGWMGITRAFAPEISGCKPSNENILKISDIMKHVRDCKSKIKLNEKLFQGRGDCFYHVPFDRLINRESRAMIEGTIKTVIRINIIEQMIGAMPVMSFVEFNEKNFDSSFAAMIAKRIQQDLATTDVGIFPRKIEKQNYWLTFLEQSVQMYWRMWESQELDYKDEDGDEALPPHIDEHFNNIRNIQETYNWKEGMWRNPQTSQGVTSKVGFFGDRDNRKIDLPGFYYDFDKKEFIDVNVEIVPVYEMQGPVPITYEEYMDADDKVYDMTAAFNTLYDEDNLTGGAYVADPTAKEIDEDAYYNETGYSWRNPPPNSTFERINKVQVGTEERPIQVPVYGIEGPYPATAGEYNSGIDSETGELLKRRSSETEAATQGGIFPAMADSSYASEYLKYNRVITGYKDKYTIHDPFDFQNQYAHYCALAYQIYGDAILYSDTQLEFGDSIRFGPSKSSWQFASCMWAVREVQDECMEILTELINFEFKEIMETFKERWKPELLDIGRYILTTDLFIDNGLKNFGTRDYEEKVAQGAIASYGEVADVVANSLTESSFPETGTGSSEIRFKIEKYIRLVEKELDEGERLPKPFEDRDSTLRGVVNVVEFQNFIDKQKEEYGEYYLSDLFGDAERMFNFNFSDVFAALRDHLNEDTAQRMADALAEAANVSVEDVSVNIDVSNNNIPSINQERRERIVEFIDKYSIVFTPEQQEALSDRTLLDDFDYGIVSLPLNLLHEDWFIEATNLDMSNATLSHIRGNIGVKYGIRIVANLPEGSGVPRISVDNVAKTKSAFEKCFYMDYIDDGGLDFVNYEKNFSFPVAVAEVDVIDHKLAEFGWKVEGGTAAYPMDVDCLLRKLIETPEYEVIFRHIMNPTSVTSMCALLSSISFDSGIGYKDGWESVKTVEDEDGNEEEQTMNVDGDEWERKYFVDTRMTLRKIFSGFYLSDDFEDPDIDTFDFSSIIKVAFGSVFGWLKKQGASVSFWWRRNLQDNPFDAEGEECKTEYEKLLD